ncbi:MAG: response regulator [Desulfobacteraceae bacterium]|nr:response regulator [Desulfobacteraceae bacterium]
MDPTYKVLIVDDASFMVKAVGDLLESDPEIRVVGSAKNGAECLEKIRELKPDVITLDIDMPIMDGITAIRHIMIETPVPIVVLSSMYGDGSITFEALRLGVVDFVPKPSGAISRNIGSRRNQIVDRIKLATNVNMTNVRRVRLRKWDVREDLTDRYGFQPMEYLLTMGTNLSGPNTFIRLLSNLSPSLPTGVVVVQEISPKILPAFAARFDEHVPWKVEAATDGARLEQGSCYIASNENSLTVQQNGAGEPCIRLGERSDEPLNLLFSSAAEVFKQNTVGVLLTGLGVDGTEGFSRIKEKAGFTIAQSASTCVYPNLTDNAIKNQTVDVVADESSLSEKIESAMV